MIEVTGLYKRYGTHTAVSDVSFSVEKGEIVGFLGPNGAGKSTTMNIITGYLSLTRGKVVIDGFDILENPEEAKKRIGYLPEIPPVYVDMTVREYLNFVYDLKKVRFPKKAHINEIMRLVRIEEVSQRLIKHLSKGYRQRVGFAQALIGNPDILILDEPTVGLDPKQIIEIRELIEKLGKNHTIILSSHILSEIQAVCKRVIVINNGKIVADDTPERLSEELSDDLSLLATVVCDGEAMKAALAELSGVKKVEFEKSAEESAFEFVITPESDADIRREIFRCVAENGGEMLSFTDNKMTLEQIFLKLTENTQSDEEQTDGEGYGEVIEEIEEVEETKEEVEE